MNVIDYGIISPEEGLELEERLLSDGKDAVAIYTRDGPTVSLGRFNNVDEYVDTNYAKKNTIAIVRRMSGGSAIYSDRDQIVFSVVTKRDSFASKSESYEIICNRIVDTLAHLGIEAEYKPKNDVLVNGMKISGCAQYRNRDTLLHHGTLILRLDSERMDSVLRPVKERKYPRLTSVEEAIERIPDRSEILDAFKDGFRDLR